MSKRVLVTGATGFIGCALTPYLVHQGFAVTILVREAYAQPDVKLLPDALTVVRPYIHTVYADLRHFDLTLRAVRETEPEVVIHLAAAGVTDPFLGVETAVRHNVNGTVNLLRACFEKTNTTRQLIVARTPGERSSMN
ncbi:MAG: NAD-dependent epimerase/dehydratase family protein, partial [Chloroflexi bacterium]|nr:NAD-dependent epimerase/dehydratase family protein [Chloroflexota bacterium]